MAKKIFLNGFENYDGIIEKIIIENDLKSISIVVKQWNYDDTHSLSELKFDGTIFQSLPEISSFNLIDEIISEEETDAVINQLNQYLKDNPNLNLSNTQDNIEQDIREAHKMKSFLLKAGYGSDWFIVSNDMFLTETIKKNADKLVKTDTK